MNANFARDCFTDPTTGEKTYESPIPAKFTASVNYGDLSIRLMSVAGTVRRKRVRVEIGYRIYFEGGTAEKLRGSSKGVLHRILENLAQRRIYVIEFRQRIVTRSKSMRDSINPIERGVIEMSALLPPLAEGQTDAQMIKEVEEVLHELNRSIKEEPLDNAIVEIEANVKAEKLSPVFISTRFVGTFWDDYGAHVVEACRKGGAN